MMSLLLHRMTSLLLILTAIHQPPLPPWLRSYLMYGPLGKYSIAMKISSKHACIVQTPASLDLHPNILLENSKLYQCVREWGIRFQCSPLTYLQQNLPSSDTVLTCLQGITIYPSGNKYGFLDKVGQRDLNIQPF